MMRTDDPIADYLRWEAEQGERECRPICADCGFEIEDDHFYLIGDECICPACLEVGYRKDIDDYDCIE